MVGSELTAPVVASIDNTAFTLTQETTDENTVLTLSFKSDVEVEEVVANLSVTSEGATPLAYQVKAAAKDLNSATLADMKVKAKEVNSASIDLYYTGKAVISYVEDNMVFLADESGCAMVTLKSGASTEKLLPGVCVNFVGRGYNVDYDWISFYQATVTPIGDYVGEWQSPLRQDATAVPDVTQTGAFVRLTGVTANAPEEVTVGIPGIYEWTETYYSCNDANGNKIDLYLTGSNPYSSGLPYEAGTAVELIGVVYPYSRSNGMPTSFIIPTCIRPAVPEYTLPVGEYTGTGENIIYDHYLETWIVNVTADENDPYRYWFDYLIPSYAGCLITVYGDLSADGKTFSVPTGFARGDGYLSCLPSEENVEAAPKGTLLVADVAEDGTMVFRTGIGLSNYTDWAAIYGMDLGISNWGLYGGEYAGATFTPVIPLPVITDLAATVEGSNATLTWTQPTLHESQELIGYRIYCNGDVAGECDAETTTFVQENLREGEYTYYVTCLVNEKESEPSNSVTVTVDTTTGISTIQTTGSNIDYNLFGTRVDKAKSGEIRIRSGHKYIVK